MFALVGIVLFVSIWLVAYRFFTDIDFYTKILSFYSMMTNIVILILVLLFNKVSFALDLVLALLLLELFIVLTFMSNKMSRDMEGAE